MENYGIKLKALMSSKRMRPADLVEKSGLKPSHVSRILKGNFGNPRPKTLKALARAFDKTPDEISRYLFGGDQLSDLPTGSPEQWDKHAAPPPLEVKVYSDYAQVHAGEPVDAIDTIYVQRPEKAPYNIKSYRVNGDCLEPELHDGEYVIVDHDAAINNGDRVVCLIDDQLHIAKLKIIGTEYWLQNRYGTHKMIECQGIARVIGHYGK